MMWALTNNLPRRRSAAAGSTFLESFCHSKDERVRDDDDPATARSRKLQRARHIEHAGFDLPIVHRRLGDRSLRDFAGRRDREVDRYFPPQIGIPVELLLVAVLEAWEVGAHDASDLFL